MLTASATRKPPSGIAATPVGSTSSAASAGVGPAPPAGDRRDRAVRPDPSDPAVAAVGDEERAVGRDRKRRWLAQQRCGGRTAVAGEPGDTGPCKRLNAAIGEHAADSVVVGVGDRVAVAGQDREIARRPQPRAGGGPAVSVREPHVLAGRS
jgi:hypothetical protein